MTTFLGRYYDPELDVSGVGAREELEQRQVARISRALSVAIVAGTMPRRLGPDASPDELSLDKKRARRAGHALGQALKQWTKRKLALPNDEAVRIEGAQIKWDDWLQAGCAEIRNELRHVATYGIQKDEQRWGNSAVVRLENELKWLELAMRD